MEWDSPQTMQWGAVLRGVAWRLEVWTGPHEEKEDAAWWRTDAKEESSRGDQIDCS